MSGRPVAAGGSIAVIGAGITGVSSGYVLAERGYKVMLFDRAEPGRTGPSFGNAGHIVGSGIFPLASPGIGLTALGMLSRAEGPLKLPPSYLPQVAPWLWRFWRTSFGEAQEQAIRALTQLSAGALTATERLYGAAGIGDKFSRAPALHLYESAQSFRASKPEWARKTAEGRLSEEISVAQIRDLQPGLAPIFTHGMICKDWGQVSDPFEVVSGLFAAGLARGIVHERREIRSISRDGDGVALQFDGGSQRFDAVLATAGVWTKALAATLGEALPVEAERGYNLTFPTPPVALAAPLVFADRGMVATELTPGLRIGGWSELGGITLPPNPAHFATMRRISGDIFPGLREQPAREWMGHRPSTPDSVPVLSRSSKHPGVFYAVGHGHYGMSLASRTSEVMGELIAEGADAKYSAFSLRRFA